MERRPRNDVNYEINLTSGEVVRLNRHNSEIFFYPFSPEISFVLHEKDDGDSIPIFFTMERLNEMFNEGDFDMHYIHDVPERICELKARLESDDVESEIYEYLARGEHDES